ncbi:hypothetical protein Tco_1101590 [Tanacetum coccineum]
MLRPAAAILWKSEMLCLPKPRHALTNSEIYKSQKAAKTRLFLSAKPKKDQLTLAKAERLVEGWVNCQDENADEANNEEDADNNKENDDNEEDAKNNEEDDENKEDADNNEEDDYNEEDAENEDDADNNKEDDDNK